MMSPKKQRISTATGDENCTTPVKLQLTTVADDVEDDSEKIHSPIASAQRSPRKVLRAHNQALKMPGRNQNSNKPPRSLKFEGTDDRKQDKEDRKVQVESDAFSNRFQFQSASNLLGVEGQVDAEGNALFSPADWRNEDDVSTRSSKRNSRCSKRTSVRGSPSAARTPMAPIESLLQDLEEDYESYLFMKTIPPIPKRYLERKAALPPKTSKDHEYTLVLDLDETLVHCSVEPMENYEMIFPVVFNGHNYQVYMRRRPHFMKFLEAVAKKFEVVVFTASQPAYADKLLDIVDPSKKLISHRLFRDSCVNIDGNYIKDLRVLGRDLTKTVLVDNSPQAFAYQVNNGIPILSWFDDDEDRELLKLIPIVNQMKKHKDVRTYLRSSFGLEHMIKNLPEQASPLQYW